MELGEVAVEPVAAKDEGRYRRLMGAHHYLGALPKIGETLWYAARWRGEWVALAGFSAPALKCGARDRWIGWDFRTQYDRQHLLANNSRFLILPGRRVPNLGSRVLALCGRRLAADWPARFGHPLLLLETFVDPARFRGTVYRAANWTCVGRTRGFRRVRGGYSTVPAAPKLVFVLPLVADARARLTRPALDPADRHGGPKAMIPADTMRSLPEFFADIDDPRRRQGRRHPLPTVLAIAAGATLCGARGYKAMAEWADDLFPARPRAVPLPAPEPPLRGAQRVRHPRRPGARRPRPARPRPAALPSRRRRRRRRHRHRRQDHARCRLHRRRGGRGRSLRRERRRRRRRRRRACGGQDRRKPVPGPHPRRRRPAQRRHPHPKKVDRLPVGADDETKRTNEIGTVVPMLKDLRLDFRGRTFTADALLTQRKLADFLHTRGAHFVFTAKGNQPTLLDDLRVFFENRGEPDFREPPALEHGRIESRAIWTTTRLNGYLTFPHVGQAFLVERTATAKKSGKTSVEYALGITSHTPDTADARRLLELNRGHWKVESVHNILDNAFDEDRLRIRTGHGPENTTRLRRFAIGVVRAHGHRCVAAAMRRLDRNPRRVFDYLRMSENTCRPRKHAPPGGRTN